MVRAMDDFRVVATVLSMVLGLAVARLLLGLVTVFRARSTCRPDWMPLAWAGVLFLFIIQYWWAINDATLQALDMNFLHFVFFVVMTFFLFLSTALLLPSRPEDELEGLRAYFDGDGRYALLALVAFLVCGLIANLAFFRPEITSAWALLEIPMIAIPCAVFVAVTRRRKALLTAVYVPLFILDLWVSIEGG